MRKITLFLSVLFFICSIAFAIPTEEDVWLESEGSYANTVNHKKSFAKWKVPTGKWEVSSVTITTSTGQVGGYNKDSKEALITWNGTGRHTVTITVVYHDKSGEHSDVTITKNPNVNIVGVQSLTPDGGKKLDGSGDCEVYVILAKANEKIKVIAVPDPSDIKQGELPDGWLYDGLEGNDKLSRDASINKAKDYKVTVTSGDDKKCVKLRVYEPKAGETKPTATIRKPGGDVFQKDDNKYYVPLGGKISLSGKDERDKAILVFADGSIYKEVDDKITDYAWVVKGADIDNNLDLTKQSIEISNLKITDESVTKLDIFYLGKDGYSDETVFDKDRRSNFDAKYNDYSQMASIIIHIVEYADVDSVKLTDEAHPDRNSNEKLEIVGSKNVILEAIKVGDNWQDNYPKWFYPEEANKHGEKISHKFNTGISIAPVAVVAGGKKYEVTAKGNSKDNGKKASVVVYPSDTATLEYDFGKVGDDVKKVLKAANSLNTGDLEVAIQLPNGKVSFENHWEERDDSPLVIWAVSGEAGLDPLIGVGGKVKVFGAPGFITKWFGANAGLFVSLGGKISLVGAVRRNKDSVSGAGEIILSGNINMSASLEAEVVKDVVDVSAIVEGGITAAAKLKYDFGKNALVWSPSIGLDEINFYLAATVGGVFQYSLSWVLIDGKDIYDGSEIIVLKGPDKE